MEKYSTKLRETNRSVVYHAEQEIDMILQITENVWVQCENHSCQKWRKVPMDMAAEWAPDTPWFCSMNPDTSADHCSKPEEKHSKYHKVARKAGIMFVFSQLPLGELVWAKTAGYCRWPGVITKDPDSGYHVSLDVDGDPLAYHVEYLGCPHTHCWVSVGQVEMYGHRYIPSKENLGKNNEIRNGKGKKKGRKVRHKPLTETDKGCRRRLNVGDAIVEAERLFPMTKSSRLQVIVYEFKPDECDIQVVPSTETFQQNQIIQNQDTNVRAASNTSCVPSKRKPSKACHQNGPCSTKQNRHINILKFEGQIQNKEEFLNSVYQFTEFDEPMQTENSVMKMNKQRLIETKQSEGSVVKMNKIIDQLDPKQLKKSVAKMNKRIVQKESKQLKKSVVKMNKRIVQKESKQLKKSVVKMNKRINQMDPNQTKKSLIKINKQIDPKEQNFAVLSPISSVMNLNRHVNSKTQQEKGMSPVSGRVKENEELSLSIDQYYEQLDLVETQDVKYLSPESSFCPPDFDAMMKQLEEDIGSLSPCSKDWNTAENVDFDDEFECLDDMEYYTSGNQPKVIQEADPMEHDDKEILIEDIEYMIEDIESDLSTLDHYMINM